jgi:penicillin-binding protein 2
MEIVCRTARTYRYPGLATHVLGFCGWRRPPDAEVRHRYSYVTRELRGRNGLELQYDEELSGSGGSMLVRVDTLGFVHERLGDPSPPKNGKDLILSLDLRAQHAAERVLARWHGALVAVDVRTGGILAMASSPSYNLAELDAQRYSELLNDEASTPLVNRAVTAGYTPGSIVKPLIGLAALEAGLLSPDEMIECTGAYEIGDAKIRCWNRYGHGPLRLVDALRESCNPFFIQLGLAAGLERIQPILASAGIGRSPRIDLPVRGAGLMPSREYAKRAWRRNWIAIDTAYVSIGQGAVSLSPLQAALATAAIANGGTLLRPYVVQAIRTPEGFICRNTAPTVEHRFAVQPQSLELIRRGMYEAVNGEHGTAAGARNSVVVLAGKTGTAEIGEGASRRKDTWFVCFGPSEDPAFATALVIEGGRSGGQTAAPAAREFVVDWLGTGTDD